MIKRYASAITTGTCMTFALLFVMQLLISIQPSAAGTTRPPVVLKPYTPIDEDPVRPIEKPIDRKLLTKVDPVPRVGRPDGSGPTIGVYVPHGRQAPVIDKITTMQSVDGPMVSMMLIQPNYPARATANGLEGHVIVVFDVMTDGTTSNIRVVESSHKIFEKPSIRAAERFKFKPRVVNGQPQPSSDIRNLFRFEMDAN